MVKRIEMPDPDTCYKMFKAHDARFDGRFFVGVATTGIYCRAVCTAKTPKRDSCSFFPTAAAAEAAGFRPCLKCRPELAPGTPASIDAKNLARQAADQIRSAPGSFSGVGRIADNLGVSERHLRRLFEDEYGVTPAQYRNTCRLLLAKGLLTETDLPISRIAFICGFSSTRRFNDAFLKSYRMNPRHFRRDVKDAALAHEANGNPAGSASPARKDASSGNSAGSMRATKDAAPIAIHIGYRAPFAYGSLVRFLSLRSIAGVEAVNSGTYRRTARIRHEDGSASCGWFAVFNEPAHSSLRVVVSPQLAEDLPYVLSRVRMIFDTDCLPDAIREGLGSFFEAAPTVPPIDGVRLPGCFDGFEMACRAILGQQITVKAASTLAGRMAAELGEPIDTPFDDLRFLFPTPQRMLEPDAAEALGRIGVIHSRQEAIIGLARAICEGKVALVPGADLAQQSEQLLALKGIGPWTVQYLLMRAYTYPDAFPAADYAVKNAFPDRLPREVEDLSQAWRPWRSYAVMTLWQTAATE
ncbi:MAG: Ada metal-binding domain-containing protein [Eggerthellaceae bacterium]|jgi:AraC family transcriptional regulator of adaptative response / DNA-3-methyladenine glycosylase II